VAVVGDAVSDYDVGWVNLVLDGPEAAATAVTFLQRLTDLAARVVLPSHGPILTDPAAAFATGLRRAKRLVDDPDGAAWYGAHRIFAYALMIPGVIPTDQVEAYLHERAWLTDAARQLAMTPEALASELVASMLRRGGARSPRGTRARSSRADAGRARLAAGALAQEWPPAHVGRRPPSDADPERSEAVLGSGERAVPDVGGVGTSCLEEYAVQIGVLLDEAGQPSGVETEGVLPHQHLTVRLVAGDDGDGGSPASW